jgi:AraC-like DNA-binding protein
MAVFHIKDHTQNAEALSKSLEILLQGTSVHSAPKTSEFGAYGQGIAATNFFIGNLTNEYTERIQIDYSNYYILALPELGRFQASVGSQKLINRQGNTGSVILPGESVVFSDSSDLVNDYIIFIHESEVRSYLNRKYHFSPVQDQIYGLDQRNPKTASLYQYIQTSLNLTRNFPGTDSALFLERNLKEIAILMMSDLIVDILDLRNSFYSPPDKNMVFKAKELIDNECHRIYTVQEIADRLNTSVRNLQKAFNTNSDTTPMRFLRERKLYKAKEILSSIYNPDRTVKSVAQEVGMLDLNRFSQYYFRMFGETPGATLKKSRK